MRRFGLDLKNSGEDKIDTGMGGNMDDEIKAKRLARFGEVDPADLKRGNNKNNNQGKKRNQKFNDKQQKQHKPQDGNKQKGGKQFK